MKRLVSTLLSLAPVLAYAQDGDRPDWAQSLSPGFYRVAFGLENWQWLALLGLLAASFAFAWLMMSLFKRFVHAMGAGTRAFRPIKRALGLLLAAMAWYPVLPEISLNAHADQAIRYGVETLTILGASWLIIGIWDAFSDRLAQRAGLVGDRAEKLLVPVIRKLVSASIVLIAFLVALGTLGVNVAGLLAGIGIGGLVFALAAKDSVENVLGSLGLLFDMPFALGDIVRIGTVEGTVEEINLRSTRLRTSEDVLITLPNSNLVRTAVENLSSRIGRRQRFILRVSHETPPEQIELFLARMRAYMEKHSKAQPGRSMVELNEIAIDSIGVLFECFFTAETAAEELRMRNDLLLEVLRIARDTKVMFAQWPNPGPPPAASQK